MSLFSKIISEQKKNTLKLSYVEADTAAGHGSTNTCIRHFPNITQVGTSITAVSTSTSGCSLTINESGIYSFQYVDGSVTTPTGFVGFSKNITSASNLSTSIRNITSYPENLGSNFYGSGDNAFVSITLPLKPGDVIRPHTSGTPALVDGRTSLRAVRIR